MIPDGLFGLVFQDGTASYFMLEIDRGNDARRAKGDAPDELRTDPALTRIKRAA